MVLEGIFIVSAQIVQALSFRSLSLSLMSSLSFICIRICDCLQYKHLCVCVCVRASICCHLTASQSQSLEACGLSGLHSDNALTNRMINFSFTTTATKKIFQLEVEPWGTFRWPLGKRNRLKFSWSATCGAGWPTWRKEELNEYAHIYS